MCSKVYTTAYMQLPVLPNLHLKNNSTLQLGDILNNENNEDIVLESVKQITGMMHTYFFSEFSAIPKNN
jgi:sorbitol-specific phosphotransferase system component IIC